LYSVGIFTACLDVTLNAKGNQAHLMNDPRQYLSNIARRTKQFDIRAVTLLETACERITRAVRFF